MTTTRRSRTESAGRFLRLATRREAVKTMAGAALGAAFFILLYRLDLPSFKLMGLATVQVDPAILAIPVAAAFFGPLAGLLAGLMGSFGVDTVFTHQVIAFGLINLSYAALGLIAGIPRYPGGFKTWRSLAKMTAFTMAGFAVMALIYLGALVYVAHQNLMVTLLYNFLPFFTVSLINLLLLTPIAARALEALSERIMVLRT